MERVTGLSLKKGYQVINWDKKRVVNRDYIMMMAIGFLLGRSSILGGLFPFGISIVAVALCNGLSIPLIILSVVIGTYSVTGLVPLQLLVSIIVLMVGYVFLKNHYKNRFILAGSLTFISVLVSGLGFLAITNVLLLYDLIMVFMESLLSTLSMLVFYKGVSVIMEKNSDTSVTTEEGISLALLLSITIMGLNDLSLMSIHLKTALSILVIYIFAILGGPGLSGAIGIIIGVLNSMINSGSTNLIGIFAFSAMFAGLFKEFGKLGVVGGYMLGNAIMVFLVMMGPIQMVSHREILVAALLLLLIPMKTVKPIFNMISGKNAALDREQAYYSRKFQEITSLKLKNFSKIFRELSKSFSEISTDLSEQNEINRLLDKIASKTCEKCSYSKRCWDRDFYKTYKEMFGLLQIIESKGSINKADLPKFFRTKCFETEKLINNANYLYEIYKSNFFWKKRLIESRELVSAQLSGISRVVEDLADEVKIDLIFDTNLEQEIILLLEKKGIPIKDIKIVRGSRGELEVELVAGPCKGKNLCKKQIEPLVSQMMGTQLKVVGDNCHGNEQVGLCNIKMKKIRPYRVAVGVSKAPNSQNTVSGDSYSFFETKDGRFVLALSDGMGSGLKASKESSTTISIVEKLLEAGFDEDVAVKTVNSIMLFRSKDENFVTMDLGVIDLSNGKIDFLKIGSVSSYIKRKQDIREIEAGSPPIGIFEKVEAKRTTTYLKDGDIIVMITDGVVESKDKINNDWLKKELSTLSNNNPNEIAEYIMKRAVQNSGGQTGDDMTVMVAKIWCA